MPLFQPQNSHRLAWAGTRTSAEKGRGLNILAMVRPRGLKNIMSYRAVNGLRLDYKNQQLILL